MLALAQNEWIHYDQYSIINVNVLITGLGVRPGNGGAGKHSGGYKAWGGNDAEKCNIKAMTVQVKVHLTWKDYLIEKLLFGVSPADRCWL